MVSNSSNDNVTSLPPILFPSTFNDIPATPIPENNDIGPCTCDLMAVACDINCCCDTDCTSEDRLVFSQCDDLLQPTEDKSYLCTYSTAVYSNNDVTTTEVISPNLFCIWADRNLQRNYYKIPDLIKSDSGFEQYVSQTSNTGYRYSGASATSQTPISQANYQSGNVILTLVSDELSSILYVPSTNGHTSSCLDTNPATFLTAQSTKCVRNLDSALETSCESTDSLNAERLTSQLANTVSTMLLDIGNTSNAMPQLTSI